MKTSKTTFIAAAIAIFALTATKISAQAIPASYSANINAEEPFTVKYLGNDGDYLLFEISVKSSEFRTATFGIADRVEGELFNKNLPTGLKAQKLKVEKRDNQELDFKLVIGKTIYTKSFTVNTTSIENTIVSEDAVSVL